MIRLSYNLSGRSNIFVQLSPKLSSDPRNYGFGLPISILRGKEMLRPLWCGEFGERVLRKILFVTRVTRRSHVNVETLFGYHAGHLDLE